MSLHKVSLTPLEKEGLEKHHLPIGKPSQLSDSFRNGIAWTLRKLSETLTSKEVESLIAFWSMRPEPGTSEGNTWEEGCKQGFQWGKENSSGCDPEFMKLLESGEHLKDIGLNDDRVQKALEISSRYKFSDEVQIRIYVLRKNGYFYRENCEGYTSSIFEAGLFTKEKADVLAKGVKGLTAMKVMKFIPDPNRFLNQVETINYLKEFVISQKKVD